GAVNPSANISSAKGRAVRVRCVSNDQADLPPELVEALTPKPGMVVFFKEELTVGEEYVVYALQIRSDQDWDYLCAHRGEDSPYRYPSQVFDLIDARPSTHWRFKHWRSPKTETWTSTFAIPEWVSDLGFYERLVDGHEAERTIFRRYRLLMDDE